MFCLLHFEDKYHIYEFQQVAEALLNDKWVSSFTDSDLNPGFSEVKVVSMPGYKIKMAKFIRFGKFCF